MEKSTYHPFIHPNPTEYVDGADNHHEKKYREYQVLRHVFNHLSQRFNDEIRELTHHVFEGNFDSLFASTPFTGTDPLLLKAGIGGGQLSVMDTDSYYQFPVFEQEYSSELGRYKVNRSIYESPLCVKAPIGEYGDELSYNLVQACRSVCTLFDIISTDCDDANNQYEDALQGGTFYRNTHVIMREAASTIATTFSLHTIKKAEGYEDNPLMLFKDCIENGIFSKSATLAPLGIIVPMANRTRGFPALVTNSKGKVALSKEEVNFFKNERERRRNPWVTDTPKQSPGCPAAPDGIRYVAEIFYKALKYHYDTPD